MSTVVTDFDISYIWRENVFSNFLLPMTRFIFLFSDIFSFKMFSYNLWYQQKSLGLDFGIYIFFKSNINFEKAQRPVGYEYYSNNISMHGGSAS
jgi:hypothetical protein